MLYSINLMPWRSQLLLDRRKRLLTIMALSFLISCLLIILIERYLSNQVEIQQSRLVQLDSYLTFQGERIELAAEQERKARKSAEQQFFLQEKLSERNANVFLMNLLPEWIPEGVHLKRLSRNTERIEIAGTAAGSLQIELLVSKIRASENADDISVQSIKSDSETSQKFVISLSMSSSTSFGEGHVAKPTE